MFDRFKKFVSAYIRDAVYHKTLVNVLLSLVFFAVYIILFVYTGADPLTAGVVVAAVYVGAVVIAGFVYRFLKTKLSAGQSDQNNPLLGNLTLDFMVKLYMPTLICDENGKIVWHNRALASKIPSRESIYGRPIGRLCGIELPQILAGGSGDGAEVAAFGGFYKLRAYRLSSRQKAYTVVVWHDVTELNRVYKKLADDEAVVAYIVIDNLEELMQYVQEKYRDASADVVNILKDWAGRAGGILKEYEHDKFIFIFSARNLDSFIAEKFDILDRIRDVRVGEGSLPVTVSIGVSKIPGTLSDKDRASHAALDMALQRGGDQVVLKTENDLEFFGGKTKSIQKRTKVRARVVASELVTLISKASNVLVMSHRYADFDAIGACAGAARLAMFCGVKVNIIANLKDPNLQKCFDKLSQQPDYHTVFIDAAGAQELIYSDTMLIIVDVNNRAQYEAPDIAQNVITTVIIDHHRKTAEFKSPPALSYIEPSASSTCELIAEILEQTLPNGYILREEAELILAGILLDTKHFTRNTGVRTFSAALYLRNEGANTSSAQALFKTGLDDFMREAKFESNVVIYRSVIAIAVNESDSNTSADRIAAAKAADKLLTIEGVVASFALCRIEDVIHISARSAGNFNVQIVLENLGGGGHYDAAATQVKDVTLAEALVRLKNTIDKFLN